MDIPSLSSESGFVVRLGCSTGASSGITGYWCLVGAAGVAVVDGVTAFGEVVVCCRVGITELLVGVGGHIDFCFSGAWVNTLLLQCDIRSSVKI